MDQAAKEIVPDDGLAPIGYFATGLGRSVAQPLVRALGEVVIVSEHTPQARPLSME